nr:MAG TPA: YtxH-like protein [Microviridae sp.]
MSWLSSSFGAVLGGVGGFLANRQQSKQFQMNYDHELVII